MNSNRKFPEKIFYPSLVNSIIPFKGIDVFIRTKKIVEACGRSNILVLKANDVLKMIFFTVFLSIFLVIRLVFLTNYTF